jgi:hypothetical protein
MRLVGVAGEGPLAPVALVLQEAMVILVQVVGLVVEEGLTEVHQATQLQAIMGRVEALEQTVVATEALEQRRMEQAEPQVGQVQNGMLRMGVVVEEVAVLILNWRAVLEVVMAVEAEVLGLMAVL